MSDSLWPHGLYSPLNCLGQNTGMGSLSLLQGIFPAQGSNPGLLHCSRICYQLNHKESPRILDWVAYPFSRGSSQHRNWTGVSCIAQGFFTNWAIREDFNAYKSAGDLVKMQILTLSSLGRDLKLCIFKQQMATQVSEDQIIHSWEVQARSSHPSILSPVLLSTSPRLVSFLFSLYMLFPHPPNTRLKLRYCGHQQCRFPGYPSSTG